MTVLDDRQPLDRPAAGTRNRGPRRPVRRGPGPARPAPAALQYRGSGARMSRAPHSPRPVSTSVSVALAGLAALITLWLGVLGQFSGERTAGAGGQPDQLAVVQVQSGETLQHLAERVAPRIPAGQVVQRIRELNMLDSSAVEAGQTLIAPVG